MKKMLLLIAFGMLFSTNTYANTDDDSESGLALPRMVSMRSNLINARSGPGARYPIEWVYRQKGAPVEIIAEYELWRKIKDWQGSQSWVHKTMLSGARTVKVVSPGESNIYAKPDNQSKIIAKVEDEVIGEVEKCPEGNSFCQVDFNGVTGWISRSHLFGVYSDEVI